MMPLEYIDISAGVAQDVDHNSFEPIEIGRAAEIVELLRVAGRAEARRGTGQEFRGAVLPNVGAELVLLDGSAIIARGGICLSPVHSAEMWRKVNEIVGQPESWMKPTAPWAAVVYPDELMLPDWFDRVVQSLAVSMILHGDSDL